MFEGVATGGSASRQSEWEARVAAAAPGPELAALLASVDPVRLTAYDRVEVIKASDRLGSWVAAYQVAAISALGAALVPGDVDPWHGDERTIRDEVAAALRLSQSTVHSRVSVARALSGRLADTRQALAAGRVSYWQAMAICEATAELDDAAAAAVQDTVLPAASEQSVAETRRALRKAVLAADPTSAQQRHARARADRRVEMFCEVDGMAVLWVLLPADQASAVMKALTDEARILRAGGDPRTLAQLRADLLADWVAGHPDQGSPAAAPRAAGRHRCRPSIGVLVSWATLAGLDEKPAQLAGYGPITADAARRVAADGIWRRLLTDPVDGQLLHLGRTRYRPNAALDEFTTVRDQVCTWPHCNRPAGDFDHAHPWAKGGTTDPDNGHRPCANHHHARHERGWQVHRLPGSRTEWTSPTGHTYTTRPPGLDDP